MQVIYQAENLIDAHLVRGRLESEGVPALVLGDHLAGGMGELPVSGLMRVCVADSEAPRALELLAAWQQQSEAQDRLDDEAEAPEGFERGGPAPASG